MTPGQTLRAGGFSGLLLADGEPLAIEGSNPAKSVTALVNRSPKDSALKKFEKEGAIDFEPSGITIVEFLISDFTGKPSGVSLIDAVNVRHRVKMIQRTEFTWLCACAVSDVV